MSGRLARAAWACGALVALAWPGHLSGPLDGMPLDGVAEAILIGLTAPILCWLHPSYLRRRAVRALIVIALLAKAASMLLVPDGWCVQFDTPKPLVTESRGRIHSWDVRADWRSRTPQCSAILTRSYEDFKRFPVWFFNMPPTDSNLPAPEDRPPYATLDMTVSGYLDADDPGEFSVEIGRTMTAELVVDQQRLDAGVLSATLSRGRHFIQVHSQLARQDWRFVPAWDGAAMGSVAFPSATLAPSTGVDRTLRGVLAWIIQLSVGAIVIGWLAAFVWCWGDRNSLVFALVASTLLAWLGLHPGPDFSVTPLTMWSVTLLGAATLLKVSPATQTLKGAFVLVGIPWIVFITAVHVSHIGRFSLYAGGDDMWMFQRFAYRIFLQGYWLQGGEPTFWFQPFYRWIAGALHMMFGDSSVGEFWWDSLSMLASALFAFQVVSAANGFRWGLAAAVLSLTLVMQSPTWIFIGIGLSDLASAGFIYFGALVLLAARQRGPVRIDVALMAGLLAAIGFYTRLNNLPMALAIAVFALPASVSTGHLVRVRDVLKQVSWPAVGGVATAIGAALLLFALRTYHYTGVFSVLHGTTWRNHALWDSGQPWPQIVAAMTSSLMMVLTFNDPPKFAWYALPLLIGAVAAVLALLRVPKFRDIPLALALFFLVACSAALAARGVAYAGRFSVHLIGAGSALTVCAAAALTTRREPSRSSDPARA